MGFWISLIASVVASWLTATAMKNSLREEGGTKVQKSSNIAQIPIVYGERKVNPTRVFVANSGGDNTYLYIILALCEGEIESITDVYLDDILSTDSKYSGLLSITKYLGSDTQAADQTFIDANIGWTSAHQLKGVAYLAVRLKWSSDAFSGIPSIQAVVKGRKIWNGTTTAYSTNPAWCLRDYLTNARYGKGLPTSFINDTLFSAAAAKCDSLVTPYTGGTQQKIFECNAVLETDRAVLENAKILLSGFRGLMPYSNGQYGVIVEDQGSSTFSFDESLIIGGISIQSETKKNRFNRVIAVFDNPDANWQSDQIEYPPTGSAEETQYLTEDGGIELEKRITLDTITNTYTAQDIAEIALKRSRNSLACTFVSTSEALNIAVGDIVDVTHSTPAWEAKPFRVNALSLRMDGTVSVELIEHQDSIYPWSTKTAADDIPDTNLPNPFYIAPITGLSVIPRASELYDGTILSILDITWDASPDSFVRRYEVDITPAGGNTTSIVTVNNTHQFYVIDVSVDYTVVVRAENAVTTSGDVTSGVITPVADTDPPAVPSSVSVNGTFQKIILGWTNPTDKDLSHVEIKRSNDSQEINATTLGTSKATSWTDGPLNGAVTRHYWIRATDTSGNSSAWVSMGSGTSIRLIADDFDAGVIDINFINSSFQDVLDAKATGVDLDTETARITSVVNEQQSIGNTIDTVAERMLTLATTQSSTLGKISDAGITVDPTTGAVSIQAVESLRTETATNLNAVQIDLDAAEATLNLKASVTYVNNTIAAAVLDSSDLAALNALEATVTQAEIDIDGAEAAILLKSDVTTVSALDLRVDQAEIDIDGAEAAILLKASSTDLTAAESRITTAETTISALDIAAITNTVSDTRTLHNKLDTSAITNLAQLLDAYKSREVLNTEIAYARQEISADVRDSNVAIASSKLELAALINDNAALITNEQIARADADSAISTSITTLTVTVGTNTGAITSEQTARADADTAMASDITTLTATVGDNTAAVVTENLARVAADSALTSSITTLGNTVGIHSATLTTHAEVVDGVSAQYSVTVNNNGHVSGFGLVSDIIDGNPTSAFIIDADQFAIGSAGSYPFVHYANDTTVTKDGIDYVLAAGTYIQDAHIQHGSITNAHIKDATIDVAKIANLSVDFADVTGTLTASQIGATEITADQIVMDGNIEFANTSSGVQFGKNSLGDTTAGAFFGRSGNVAGFNISSSTSGIYADSTGQVALNNVRLYSGVAGNPFEYPNTGTFTANISSLTTAISVIIIGGGGGACNNAAAGTSTGNTYKRAGTSGTASYIKWYSGQNGTGTLLGTYTGTGGAGLAASSVGSNTSSASGTTGQASSKAAGGSGGTYGYNYSGTLPTSGTFGSGGGGAANGSTSSGTPNAPVNQTAGAGGTISQLLNKPSGAQSIEIHVGTGGTGGQAFSSPIIYAGGNGGDGFVSYADPNSGGIEIDLTAILNRLTALEA